MPPFLQQIADRVAQYLEIIPEIFQLSTRARRTWVLTGFIVTTMRVISKNSQLSERTFDPTSRPQVSCLQMLATHWSSPKVRAHTITDALVHRKTGKFGLFSPPPRLTCLMLRTCMSWCCRPIGQYHQGCIRRIYQAQRHERIPSRTHSSRQIFWILGFVLKTGPRVSFFPYQNNFAFTLTTTWNTVRRRSPSKLAKWGTPTPKNLNCYLCTLNHMLVVTVDTSI